MSLSSARSAPTRRPLTIRMRTHPQTDAPKAQKVPARHSTVPTEHEPGEPTGPQHLWPLLTPTQQQAVFQTVVRLCQTLISRSHDDQEASRDQP
jgi:hypothetical protein